MDITHGTINRPRGHFQRRNHGAGIDVARGTWENLTVSGILQQHGCPAHLEVHPGLDVDIHLAEFLDKTRFRFDEMRIFRALGEDHHRHVLPTDLTSQAPQFRSGSSHAQRLLLGSDTGEP